MGHSILKADYPLMINWFKAKGYSGSLNEMILSHFRTLVGNVPGYPNDLIARRMNSLGFTGDAGGMLNSFFCQKTGATNPNDGARLFFSNSSIDFSLAGINSFTKLMLHCDGTNGGTTFTDSSLVPVTMTANGGAVTSTAQKVFGTASGLMAKATSSNVTTPDSANWYFGSSPFTIDFRIRFVALAADGDIVSQYQDANNYWSFLYRVGVAGLYFQAVTGGAVKCDIHCAWSPSINTWYWIKYTRTGSTSHLYIDGVDQTLVTTTPMTAGDMGDLTGSLTVGGLNNGFSYGFTDGYFDEVRIQNGEADDSTSIPSSAYTT